METDQGINESVDPRPSALQSEGFSFIILTKGNQSGRANRIKAIRSHAAQVSHTRKRKSRDGRIRVRYYQPVTQTWHSKESSSNGQESTFTGPRGTDRRGGEQVHLGARQWTILSCPSPQDALVSGRRNLIQSHARDISSGEGYLIDHYVTYVVEHGYTECDHGDDQQLFLNQMRAFWVPWSLADRGLLAGILMTASRSLQSLCPGNTTYSTSLLVYKAECITQAREAISCKTKPISDYTIALALVLAAEEFMAGNIERFHLHCKAIMEMAKQRKNNSFDLGPGGFLSHLLSWSVYNPKFGVVNGPYRQQPVYELESTS